MPPGGLDQLDPLGTTILGVALIAWAIIHALTRKGKE